MLALISPAKKLGFQANENITYHTQPDFLEYSQQLVSGLQRKSKSRLKALMKLSDALAELNYERYQNFSTPFTEENAYPAIALFQGDTYVGLDAKTLSKEDVEYAQNHLRILSGLYGLLRPVDLMQEYRLEMGTKFANAKGEDLYDFWSDILANACNQIVKDHKDQSIVCLASNEYMKSIPTASLNTNLIICHFKEIKDGTTKTIGLFAKKARGMMARFMIQNRIEARDELKTFQEDGYQFSDSLSDQKNYVFLRER